METIEITKDFLESIINSKIKSYSITPGSNPGDNYMSIIHSIEIELENNGENPKKHLLLKCYPSHPARIEFLNEANVFAKELNMYTRVIPDITSVLKEEVLPFPKLVSGRAVDYSNKVSVEGSVVNLLENYIMMEDLRKSNYKMAKRQNGLDLNHTKLVIKNQAKIHALSWVYKQRSQVPILLSKYPLLKDAFMEEGTTTREQFASIMDSTIDSTLRAIEREITTDSPIYKATKEFFDANNVFTIFDLFFKPGGVDEDGIIPLLKKKPSNTNASKDSWLVLCHGDCWVNNFLFKYNPETNEPEDVIFVDLQLMRETCPTTDLAYFLFSSVPPGIRKVHEKTLLQMYHDTFVEICQKYEVEPLPGFSFDNLVAKFNRAKLLGLVTSLALLKIVLQPQELAMNLEESKESNLANMFDSILSEERSSSVYDKSLTQTVTMLYEDGII